MRTRVVNLRLLLLLAVSAPWLLVVREAMRGPPAPPVPPREVRERRLETAIHRHDRVQATVREVGVPQAVVLERAGEPTARLRGYRDRSVVGIVLREVTPDGPDEVWVYDIDDGVRITVLFDADGKTYGYGTTGVRESARALGLFR